jgi:hypothetical protein
MILAWRNFVEKLHKNISSLEPLLAEVPRTCRVLDVSKKHGKYSKMAHLLFIVIDYEIWQKMVNLLLGSKIK